MCGEANTAQGEAKCCICLETPLEYCIFIHTSKAVLYVIIMLYFLGRFTWSDILKNQKTAMIFGDQAIVSVVFNPFLAVK